MFRALRGCTKGSRPVVVQRPPERRISGIDAEYAHFLRVELQFIERMCNVLVVWMAFGVGVEMRLVIAILTAFH